MISDIAKTFARRGLLGLLGLIMLPGAGCDDNGSSGRCQVGETRPCMCPTGREGGQACGADERYGDCVCTGDEGPPDVAVDAELDQGRCEPVPGNDGLDPTCDDVDDDCDGQLAEDYEPVACNTDRPAPCEAGVARCRLIDRSARTVCEAEDGQPLEFPRPERCDGVDDDCDGLTDEGFDTATDPLNCGACGRECAAPGGVPLDNASFRCEASACVIDQCAEGFTDEDGLAGNGCECGADVPDAPDPSLTDLDCDGRVDEDIDEGRAVFVSGTRGDDGGDGTRAAPVATLGAALVLADADARPDVILEAGPYDPFAALPADDPARRRGLSIPPGVHLRGGFTIDEAGLWYRDLAGGRWTRIEGNAIVLRYADLDRPTLLEAVDVVARRGADGQLDRETGTSSGTSSIGVVAENVGEHLLIANAQIEAGAGGAGFDGRAGIAGARGVAGDPPTIELVDPTCPHEGALRVQCGGLGGITRTCDPIVVVPAGGDGGDIGMDGQPGEGYRDQMVALGGASRLDGNTGADGIDGAPSAPGEVHGSIVSGVWTPSRSESGGAAWPGGGGGGGGGGLEYGGGGGGGGGCPGPAGGGAEGGYGSFAIVVRGGRVALMDRIGRTGRLRLVAGAGGLGGRGGGGWNGGVGGAGAPGIPDDAVCAGDCTPGGAGGAGGRGGCGGHAGGGAGGPSFVVLRIPTGPGAEAASDAVFIQPSTDALEPGGRVVAGQAAAVAAHMVLGQAGTGGQGGINAQTCPDVEASEPGPSGLVGAIACCRINEGGLCAPLEPCGF